MKIINLILFILEVALFIILFTMIIASIYFLIVDIEKCKVTALVAISSGITLFILNVLVVQIEVMQNNRNKYKIPTEIIRFLYRAPYLDKDEIVKKCSMLLKDYRK